MLSAVGLCGVLLLLALSSCSLLNGLPPAALSPQPDAPDSIIVILREQVQEAISRYVRREERMVLDALRGAQFFPAEFKRPSVLRGLTDPWNGLAALEAHGMQAAAIAGREDVSIAELTDQVEAAMNRSSASASPPSVPVGGTVEEHVAYLLAVLDQAHALRTQALRDLGRDDRQFLFDHAAAIVETFSPQRSGQNEHEMVQATRDRRFVQLVEERLDYGALMAAAKLFAQFDNDSWIQRLEAAFRGLPATKVTLDGVTGDILLIHEAPPGLVVVGGAGPNTYNLDQRFALVIDVGGDDSYRGTIASAADIEHGLSVIIDLAGNDRYEASPMGLATGRLGVGFLIERSGDDIYSFASGSGGAGFAGIGILHDKNGHDRYAGGKFTQGAAIGGLGLLIDDRGNDTHTSFGYAIGFGGPLGVGALIDVSGDDSYQCGAAYPSRYNDGDVPDGKPDHPRFQYDAFGLGTGTGVRIFSKNHEHLALGLAGGLGFVVDLDGHDRYRSSNFSQGSGYFFGMGMKLDLAGNDEHAAARYGHGASAHYGVGIFVDRQGADRYTSTGPVYNGGTAWDLSVSLCIDAGDGDDVYELRRSDGLGRADHRSWSFFIEEGGRDRYVVPYGMGAAADRSLSGFLDLAGDDEYVILAVSGRESRGNGRAFVDHGGVFVDR